MNKDEVIIRRARTSDLVDVVRLCAEHADYENIKYREENKEMAIEKQIFSEPPGIHCLVLENDGAVVGYTTFMKQVSTWSANCYLYIDCMYIEQEFRGRGLGTQIFQRLAQEARDLDCGQLQWQTPEQNKSAIGFYERLGGDGLQKVRFTWEPSDAKPQAKTCTTT